VLEVRLCLAAMSTPPLVDLNRAQMRAATKVDRSEATAHWCRALSRDGSAASPVGSILREWSEFAGISYDEIFERLERNYAAVVEEWRSEPRDTADSIVSFYDRPADWFLGFHLNYHAFDSTPPLMALASAQIMKAAGASRVLDVGAGAGATALALAAAGLRVGVLDVAPEALRLCQYRLEARGREPEALIDDRDGALDREQPGSWHGAVLFEVLEHVPDPVETISRVDRVLAPEGIIALSQAFCHYADGTIEFPRRGEVLAWLAQRGYRLHHRRGVAWFAQKSGLAGSERLAQRASIAARVAAARAATDGPIPESATHMTVSALVR
jgi:2-polyprenyl-3-methyl-5-hydroxy-6-metoxy-1,4-benzoquinol methylase